MNLISTKLSGLTILEPTVFKDHRGFFVEFYNQSQFNELIGSEINFKQDNQSHSFKNVLRGLHYQVCRPQAKLVRVSSGVVLNVTVDIRKSSPTFGQHITLKLSADNKQMLWIPEGFAHGFVVLSDTADLIYKTTDYWYQEHERCISWNDPTLAIDWQLQTEPILSNRDAHGKTFAEAELFD
jgi:dTDP-4-dehydrorhamnose 3,5-epimerase